eukprot:3390132-Rhodomonas_salina.3
MSGTDVAYGATRASNFAEASPLAATRLSLAYRSHLARRFAAKRHFPAYGFARRCPVLTSAMLLRIRSAMSGTDTGHAVTRRQARDEQAGARAISGAW